MENKDTGLIKGESIRKTELYKQLEDELVCFLGRVLNTREPEKMEFFASPRGKNSLICHFWRGKQMQGEIIGKVNDGVS